MKPVERGNSARRAWLWTATSNPRCSKRWTWSGKDRRRAAHCRPTSWPAEHDARDCPERRLSRLSGSRARGCGKGPAR